MIEAEGRARVGIVTVTVAELAEMGGRGLGSSPWLRISQPRIDRFADATDDHQWIHVDPEQAAEGPFGTTIAHGYLTLSLVPWMLDEVLEVSDQVRGTNYGLERVRFTNPVPVESEIRLKAALASAERRHDDGVKFTVDLTVEIKGQERPALMGQAVYLAYDA